MFSERLARKVLFSDLCLPQRRQGAKKSFKNAAALCAFASLRETIFLTSVLQVFEDEVGHHLAHVLEL